MLLHLFHVCEFDKRYNSNVVLPGNSYEQAGMGVRSRQDGSSRVVSRIPVVQHTSFPPSVGIIPFRLPRLQFPLWDIRCISGGTHGLVANLLF